MMTLGLIVSISVTFCYYFVVKYFSSDDDINVKDTEKSKITSALGNFQKKIAS